MDIDGGPDVDDEELGNEALCEDGRLDFDDEDVETAVLRDRQTGRQTETGRERWCYKCSSSLPCDVVDAVVKNSCNGADAGSI